MVKANDEFERTFWRLRQQFTDYFDFYRKGKQNEWNMEDRRDVWEELEVPFPGVW